MYIYYDIFTWRMLNFYDFIKRGNKNIIKLLTYEYGNAEGVFCHLTNMNILKITGRNH